MKDTAILITTFLRDHLLFRCIDSIRKFYPDIVIYIGDNGNPSSEKDEFLKANKCRLIQLDFDLGVGGTRNEAIERIPKKYRYLIVCEDDIIFTKFTRLETWRTILDADPEVGLAGGLLARSLAVEQHYEANTWIDGDTHYIEKVKAPEWREVDGTRYFLCDLILNVFMMRREVWDAVKWDPQFKTALEHSDFFLRLKYKSAADHMPVFDKSGAPVERRRPIRAAYCPDVWMFHKHDDNPDPKYTQYRSRPIGFALFGEKWGVKFSNSDFNRINPIPYTRHGMEHNAKDDNLECAIRILEHHKCKWWLEAGTCLGAVRQSDFISHDPDIDIGLPAEHLDLWDTLQEEFIAAGFKLYQAWEYKGRRIELSFRRDGVKLDLFFFFRSGNFMWHGAYGPNEKGQWGFDNLVFLPHVFSADLFEDLREMMFRGKRCFLPSPPEQYLAERYGPKWGEPDAEYKYWLHCRAVERGFFKRTKPVFIGGVWDLFHVGHLNILERAEAVGTKLTVGVLTDEAAVCYKPAPLVPFADRKRIVEALGFVDRVIEQNDTDPTADLKRLRLKPHYIVHGSDWDVCPGEEYVRENGGRLLFFPYTPGVSSTGLRQAIGAGEAGIAKARREIKPDLAKLKIAIGIKTYLREETFLRCLKAIRENVHCPYRLYIADDSGEIGETKAAVYNRLRADGHEIIRLPKNSGISIGRNAIVKRAREKVILIMDDDIEITNGKCIDHMLTALFADPDMGIMAGMLSEEKSGQPLAGSNEYSYGLRLERESGMITRFPAKREDHGVDGTHYRYADQVINFFMARREVFDCIRWDNRIKVGHEHIDFFLTLKEKATHWKVATCLDAKAIHLRSLQDPAYNQARQSINHHYFLHKHRIHRVLNRYD